MNAIPTYADLSTYNISSSITFYEKVFGWKFESWDENYLMARAEGALVAGLYEMPLRFKQMRMPHFWMTYIRVDNVSEAVELATKNNGKIELQEQIPYFSEIALIRDPSGAGFTIHNSDLLQSRVNNAPNQLIWNELHVSNSQLVIDFYAKVFSWKAEKLDSFSFKITNEKGSHITDFHEIPNSIKGRYEYWICSFQVESVDKTKEKILSNGGAVIHVEPNRILCTDNSQEAFFYIVASD